MYTCFADTRVKTFMVRLILSSDTYTVYDVYLYIGLSAMRFPTSSVICFPFLIVCSFEYGDILPLL